jgi:hypothetical protein
MKSCKESNGFTMICEVFSPIFWHMIPSNLLLYLACGDSMGASDLAALGRLFTPTGPWLVSLFFATRVFLRKDGEPFLSRIRPEVNFNEVSTGAWQKVKDVYRQAAEEKLRWLHRSHGWLVASFALILLAAILFVCLPIPPSVGPTQILIVTPTPVVSPLPTP